MGACMSVDVIDLYYAFALVACFSGAAATVMPSWVLWELT